MGRGKAAGALRAEHFNAETPRAQRNAEAYRGTSRGGGEAQGTAGKIPALVCRFPRDSGEVCVLRMVLGSIMIGGHLGG